MVGLKDGVFATLFGTEHLDCVVWQFDGDKIHRIWTSVGRKLLFLKLTNGRIAFSRGGHEVPYTWTNGGWVEQPLV
jgi:hypothetical protein